MENSRYQARPALAKFGAVEMIGNNEMHLNQATMIEIVQYWLTNKLLNTDNYSPVVKSVKLEKSGDETFVVRLEGNTDAA